MSKQLVAGGDGSLVASGFSGNHAMRLLPVIWFGIATALVFLLPHWPSRGSGTPAGIELSGDAGYPEPATQNLLLAVRTAEWQTVETGLLDIAAVAPPRPCGFPTIDRESLADAMFDPQTFAYLPADTTDGPVITVVDAQWRAISVSPSSR
jgi:hypothetical protein